MSRLRWVIGAGAAAVVIGSSIAKSETIPTPASTLANGSWTITPAQLKWEKGFFGGSPHAAILGDETKSGLYIYRTLVPKGQRTPVHLHPDYRFVTVMSGTLRVGFTDKFDAKSMTVLPPGGAWIEPVRHAHYIWAKDGDVIVQVMGFGPTKMIPYPPNTSTQSTNQIKTGLP
jgi:quercetin dioxygenase-like cupin family protein